MLRYFAVLAVAAFCLSAADKFTADKDFVAKQKDIFEILWHVTQPTTVNPKLAEEGTAWDIKANIDSYTNKEAVEEFLQRYHHGMLPREKIFSLYYPEIREETVALYKLFYYAKDYATFYKTALWARLNVNGGQFVHAFTVAVINRPDTKFLRLPSPYELYPNLFFNSEVIQQAQNFKMQHKFSSNSTSGVETAVIPANYSGWFFKHDFDYENKLAYFTEDIGFNTFYYYNSIDAPFWMNSNEYNHIIKNYRGKNYYFTHKAILTRYYLERLSNDMGEIEDFDWDKPFLTGYYPTMTYHNGLPLPQRERWSDIPMHKYKYVQEIKDLEHRIIAAIDSGYMFGEGGKYVNIYTPEGLNLLGNIIEGNADSYNKKFYGAVDALARDILGFNLEPSSKYQIAPSVLQQTVANLRDPAFYRLYKRILNFFMKYKSQLPVYTHEELAFPGVKVESLTVDPLITYFDHFDTLINNVVAVQSPEDAQSFLIKARQYRLNHKPFSYHLNVTSDKDTQAAIRMFIGPKYDEHHRELDISENFMNFFELDHWIVNLTTGENKIDRSSHEAVFVIPDQLSSELFYDKVKKAFEGGESFSYGEAQAGFPARLLLPKGKKEGMPFQLFAYVSKFDEAHSYKLDSPLWGNIVLDGKTGGFPLDRPVYGYNFTVPNMYFQDVKIFHKEEAELNVTV